MVKKHSGFILVFLFTMVIFAGCSKEASFYKKGMASMNAGQYLEAIENFSQAGSYEDAESQITESYYQLGLASQTEKDYIKAIEYYSFVGNYLDAPERINVCKHLEAVRNDTEAPIISGIEEELIVQCGSDFNLNDYIKERVNITDNTTNGEIPYSILCDEEAYEHATGKLITTNYGDFTVVLSAKDEAGNEATVEFKLVLAPIHISVDNLTPIVYDGEFARIQLLNFKHGSFYGEKQYLFTFEVDNKTDELIDVYFRSSYTTINRYQIQAYYTIEPIGAGNIGRAEIHIYDKDIPENVGVIEQIITRIGIKTHDSDEAMYHIPMIIDVNAAK